MRDWLAIMLYIRRVAFARLMCNANECIYVSTDIEYHRNSCTEQALHISLHSGTESPENVINHRPICVVVLEVLNVPNKVSSLGTANWWQEYAWGRRPVPKGSMPHLLP